MSSVNVPPRRRPLTFSLGRLRSSLAISAAIALAGSAETRAAAISWDGEAGDFLWTSPTNWSGDALPSATAPGDDLTFGTGAVGVIDLVADQLANRLTFNAGFTLGLAATLNTLTLTTGEVTVNAGVTATLNTLLNTGASALTKRGAGTLVINSASTAIGAGLLIEAGVAELGAGAAIGGVGSQIFLGATSGSDATTLRLGDVDGGTTILSDVNVQAGSSGLKTIAFANTGGTNTLAGFVSLSADTTVSAAAGGTGSFTGLMSLADQTVTVAGPGSVNFGGTIGGSNLSRILKTGTGTATISGDNSISGWDGQVDVREGQLVSANNGALALATVKVGDTAAGGIANAALLANGGITVSRPILVQTGAGNTGTVTLGGNLPGLTPTSAADFSGPITLGKGVTLTAPQLGLATFSGALLGSAATPLTKSGTGVVRLTAAAASNASSTFGDINVTAGTLELDPGLGNTLSLAGAASVNGGGIRVASGMVNLGSTVIATNAPSFVAGLREGFIARNNASTAFEEFAANPGGQVQLGTTQADVVGSNQAGTQNILSGWVENSTYVYSGQIVVPASGQISFAESFDDNVLVRIDGVQRLRNTVYNVTTGSGVVSLTPGVHNIEIRFGNGATGFGYVADAVNGWPGLPALGFGYSATGTTSLNRADYVAAVDPGDMSLFRTNANYSVLTIDPGATLSAGGFANTGSIQLFGNVATPATLALNDAAAPRTDTVENITLSTPLTGQASVPGTLNIGNNHTVTAGNLTLANNANLTVNGTGNATFNVTNDPLAQSIFGTNATLTAATGAVNLNGTLPATGNLLQLAVGAGTVSIAENASLGRLISVTPGAATGAVNVAAGRSLTVNSGIYSGALNAGGDLLKNAAGFLDLSGKATIGGNTLVSAGTLRLSNTATGGGASTFATAPSANTGGAIAVAVDPTSGASGLGASAVTLNGGTLRIGPEATGLAPGAAGITGRYFNSGQTTNNTFDTNFYNTPTVTRVDSQINFPDITQAAQRPAGINGINISIIWGGFINITTGGLYTFTSSSDDGTTLLIDGVPVVVNEGGHGTPGATPTGTIFLEPGLHSFHERYVQGGGGAAAVVSYAGPDTAGATQVIPASAFFQGSTAVTLSNTVNVSDGATSAIDASGADVTLAGAVTLGSGSTLNLGSNTAQQMTISGSLNYAGGAAGATVQIPATSLALMTAGFLPTLSGNVGFAVADGAAANDLTVPFVLRGTASITKSGAGTLALSGANTFGGAGQTIAVNGGLISIAGDTNLGHSANALVFSGGGGLRNTGPLTLSRPITLNAGGGAFDTAADLTVLTPLTGPGGLIKTGPATLFLPNNTSSFGGAGQSVSVTGGLVSVSAGGALGHPSNSLTLDGGGLQATGTFPLGRALTLGAGGGTLDVLTGHTLTLDTSILGPGGLRKSGAGRVRTRATTGAPFGIGPINFIDGILELLPDSIAAALVFNNGSTLTYGGGDTFILDRNGNTSLEFIISNLARSGNGTLVFAPGSGIGNFGTLEKLTVTGGVPLENTIVNPAVVGQDSDANRSGDFLTTNATNQLVRANYSAGFNSGSSTEIAEILANITANANEAAAAAKVAAGVQINPSVTVSIGTGAGQAGVIFNGGSFSGSGTLAFGGAEAAIYASNANGTISSALTGSGGLTKFGPGVLTLAGNLTGFTGGLRVNQGSINLNAATGSDPTAGNAITLTGGGLDLTPSAVTARGLLGRYFNGASPVAAITASRDHTAAAGGTRVDGLVNFAFTAAAPAPGVGTVNGANLENFGAQYTGMIFIPTGGPQTFSLASDDGSRLFIDGRLVIENDGGQGGTYLFSNTVNLTPGYHEVRVDYTQGTGGGNVRLITPFGLSPANLFVQDPISLGTAVNVTADSAINLNSGNFTRVGIGAVTQTGGTTLTINGDAGKLLQLASFTNSGAGAIGLNTVADLNPGVVALPGATIVKQGPGRLILDNTLSGTTTPVGTPNNLSGAFFDVRAGRLVIAGSNATGSTNPIAGATVQLSGGGLLLDTKSNAVTYDNSAVVAQNSTIESQPAGITLTLGSASRTLAINSGATLTVDNFAGSSGMAGTPQTSIGNIAGSILQVNSVLTGSGAIFKTSTAFGAPNGPTIFRNWGQLTIASDSPAFSGAITIDRGILQANAAASAAPKPFGTGPIALMIHPSGVGGVSTLSSATTAATATALFLKSNGTGSNTTINFGNNVNIAGTGNEARFDVNFLSANTGNTIQMGALGLTAASAPNFNTFTVTAGNTYSLAFTAASPVSLAIDTTFNLSGGLVLPMDIAAAGRALTKIGTGTLTLGGATNFSRYDAFSGTLAFNSLAAMNNGASPINLIGAALNLGGSASLADGTGLANTITPSFGRGSGLRFDNTLANNTNRFGDNVTFTLTNNVLELVGNATAPSSEAVGAVTFAGGAQLRVQRGAAGVTSTLTLGGLTRANNGTVQINTTTAGLLGGADNKLLVASGAPANVAVNAGDANADNMTSPHFVSGTDNQFVQYDPVDGFKTTRFSTRGLNAAVSTDVVDVSGAITLSTNPVVHALRFNNAINLSGANNTVTIGSGGLIMSHPASGQTSNSAFVFGSLAAPAEALIFHNAGSNFFHTISGKITANGLTKFGANSATIFSADNSWDGVSGNPGLRGTITINSGPLSFRETSSNVAPASLSFGRGGALANSTNLVLAGGVLEGRYNNAINIGDSGVALGTGNLLNVSVIANSNINLDRTGSATNQIAHFGTLSIANDVTLQATGGNGYRAQFNGTTTLGGGNIIFDTTTVLNLRAVAESAPTSITKRNTSTVEIFSDSVNFTGAAGTRIEAGVMQWDFNFNFTTPANGLAAVAAQDLAFGGTFAAPLPITLNAPLGQVASFRFRSDANALGTNGALHRISNPITVGRDSIAQLYAYQGVNAALAATPRINYVGPIALGGTLYIGEDTGSQRGALPLYSGAITLDQTQAGSRSLVYTTGTGGRAAEVQSPIQDGAGGAGNALTLQARNGPMNITTPSASMTYAGGTIVLQSDIAHYVSVAAASRLGTGNVTVEGGQLILGALTNLDTGRTVLVNNRFGSAGLLTLAFDGDPSSIINPASQGVLGLDTTTATTAANFTTALNQATLGKLFLGAQLGPRTYTAATLGAGADGFYRLGGGYAALTITNGSGNILTGANGLLVGQALTNGGLNSAATVLNLSGSNNFTGGTTVDFGGGTFNVNGANGLGTGSLTVNSGIVTIAQAQSITGAFTMLGGTVNANVDASLGASSSIVMSGGTLNLATLAPFAAGTPIRIGGTFPVATINFNSVERTLSGPVTLMNAPGFAGAAHLRANSPTTLTGTLDFAGNTLLSSGSSLLNVTGAVANQANANLIVSGPANAQTAGTIVPGSSAVSFDTVGKLPGGNVNLNGGVLVLNNATWADFVANRSGGFNTTGAGANTWSIGAANAALAITTGNTGGFAARGTSLIIDASGTTTSTFDRNFTLGSNAMAGNALFANRGVTLAQSTQLTGRRTIFVAPTGPGLTFANGAVNTVIHRISGDFADGGSPGGVIFRATANSTTNATGDGQVGEIVLSGANTWTGSSVVDIDGGANVNLFNTGRGGLMITGADTNPGTLSDLFVRFDDTAKAAGQTSLPSGNAGATAYLFANRYGGTGAIGGRTGFLLTGDADGQVYQLATGMKFLLGAINNLVGGVATLGSTGGSATLQNSAVSILSGGTANQTNLANSMVLLVRDGRFELGTAAGAVSFQPSSFNGTNNTGTDSTITGAASTLVDVTAGTARTIIKRGLGTAIVGNVAYHTVAGTGDTSGSFTWQIGNGTAGIFDGAIRETSATGTTANLSNVKVTMNGGVLEFSSDPRFLSLGANASQVNMNGAAGGGFAAVGAARNISLNGGTALTWNTGNFVSTNAPLIFGSATADNTARLVNNIDLGGASQQIASVRGVGSAPEGEIVGNITGAGGVTLNALRKPDTTLLPPGTVIFSGTNSYTGATTINGGTLRVGSAGAIPTGAGAGNVVVNSGGALDLAGSAITINGLTSTTGTAGRVTNSNAAASVFTVGNNDATAQFDGVIENGTGAVALTKVGAGTLTLTNSNTYTGATTINAGTLRLGGATTTAAAAAQWLGDSISGAGGAAVTTWTDTVASKAATTAGTAFAAPTLATGVLGGHNVVRFSGASQALQVAAADSVISGVNDFTIALVFRADTNGVGPIAGWYNNAGLIDAEQSGTQADWGLGFNSNGQVAGGIGNPDVNAYSPGGLANGAGHVVLFTRQGGTITTNVDGVSTTATGGATTARGAFRFLFGSLNGLNGQYFAGDFAEVRMFTSALNATQLNALGFNLATTYAISGTTFTAAPANFLPSATPVSIASGATLDVNNVTQAIGSLAGAAGSSVTLGALGTGSLAIGTDNTSTTFAGAISGTGMLIKQGTGTLTLSGASSYAGQTLISAGIVEIQNAAALGATGAGNGTRVLAGGALEIEGDIVTSEPLTLNGTGIAGAGAVRSASGANTLSGVVTLESAASAGVDAGNLTLSGGISGSTTFTKVGPGTLAISGDSSATFTGGVFVDAGVVNLASANLGSSNVTVDDTATLTGNGTVKALTAQSGANISPGNSPGSFTTTGDFTLGGGATLSLELGKTTAGAQPLSSDYDFINIAGTGSGSDGTATAIFGGGNMLSLSLLNSGIELGDVFFIVRNDGTDQVTGLLGGFGQGAVFDVGPQRFQVTYFADSGAGTVSGGNDVALVAVPEPGSWPLLLAGLGAVLGLRRFPRCSRPL